MGALTVDLDGVHCDQYEVSSDRLAMIFNSQMCVWDFTTNERAIWAIKTLGQYESVRQSSIRRFPRLTSKFQLSFKDNYLIVGDGTGVTIWDVPPLHPIGSLLGNEVQNLQPRYHFDLETAIIPGAMYNYEFFGHWYSSATQDSYFDVCQHEVVEMARYRVEFSPDTCVPSHGHNMAPKKMTKMFTFRLPEVEGFLEDYRVSDDHIVLYWSAPTGLNVQVAPLDIEESVSQSLSTLAIFQMSMVERCRSSLCSASGRLCYMADSDMLAIVDFLGHP